MLRSFPAKPVALTSLGAVLVAALIGAATIFLSSGLEVKAAPQTGDAVHQSKGDRLIIPTGAACSGLEWPNYELRCQFDIRRPADNTRTVRVIALR